MFSPGTRAFMAERLSHYRPHDHLQRRLDAERDSYSKKLRLQLLAIGKWTQSVGWSNDIRMRNRAC